MLQDMEKEVEAEGNKEEELFDKFMCYCSGGEASLASSIAQGKAAVEQLSSEIKLSSGRKSQLEQEVAQAKADRLKAQIVMKESAALREKEEAAFAAESGDMKSNIEAMSGAIASLKQGVSATLLQTRVGNVLKSVVLHSPIVRPAQRETLMSFLESGSTEGSDEIIGVLQQMKETV